MGEGTRLSAQIGYLEARYDEFDDARSIQLNPAYNPSLHEHVPFSPEVDGAPGALTQTFNLRDGARSRSGGDASYRDRDLAQRRQLRGLSQKAYTLVGLFGVYDSADGHWQFRAGVRNLTDKVYKTDGQEFSSVGNIRTAYYAWPRNYYVSARYSF